MIVGDANKGEKMNYAEQIASQMVKGLSDEKEQIRDIYRVMLADGRTSREINYHMNIDEDFIPDVLQFYN